MQSVTRIFGILLLCATQDFGAIALVASAKASAPTSGTATTSAIDTTGATLLVVGQANLGSSACSATLSDSKSNTFTSITNSVLANNNFCFKYVCNPTVGSGHTFSGSGSYAAIFPTAWSGTATSLCADVHSEGSASADSVQAGSVTPSQANSLVIAGLGAAWGNQTLTINGGFTIAQKFDVAGDMEGGIAYLIQTTATAANPTWSIAPSSDNLAAAIAVFKPAAGAAAHAPSRGFTF